MKILTKNLGKKYRNEWIFRNVNLEFHSGDSYTFVGPNGSGKSTLMQVISGVIPQTEGKIEFFENDSEISIDEIFKKIVIAAPYLELVEEFTLSESLIFHQKFKKFNYSISEILHLLNLEPNKHKLIKNFSSGMKQRLKLGLAFFSDSPIILLDEPTSNLDSNGIDWYLKNIEENTKNRLLIICSNQTHEYGFCKKIVDIRDFK